MRCSWLPLPLKWALGLWVLPYWMAKWVLLPPPMEHQSLFVRVRTKGHDYLTGWYTIANSHQNRFEQQLHTEDDFLWHHYPSVLQIEDLRLQLLQHSRPTGAHFQWEGKEWIFRPNSLGQSYKASYSAAAGAHNKQELPTSGVWVQQQQQGNETENAVQMDVRPGVLLMKRGRPIAAAQKNRPSRLSSTSLAAQILQHPTTSMIWALNVGLYLYYWNYRIDPASVALTADWIMTPQQDYYRPFTGGLAHFDLWHIGLNMISWWNVGRSMEVQWGSLTLLAATASTLLLTAVVYSILLWMVHWWKYGTFFPDQTRSAVGFSGVLFAWMVVATLSSNAESCPIPGFPHVCFATHALWGNDVSFNWGPFVQLVVLQMVLPRVASFWGHLAGIVVGFVLVWSRQHALFWSWILPSRLFPLIWWMGEMVRNHHHHKPKHQWRNLLLLVLLMGGCLWSSPIGTVLGLALVVRTMDSSSQVSIPLPLWVIRCFAGLLLVELAWTTAAAGWTVEIGVLTRSWPCTTSRPTNTVPIAILAILPTLSERDIGWEEEEQGMMMLWLCPAQLCSS